MIQKVSNLASLGGTTLRHLVIQKVTNLASLGDTKHFKPCVTRCYKKFQTLVTQKLSNLDSLGDTKGFKAVSNLVSLSDKKG